MESAAMCNAQVSLQMRDALSQNKTVDQNANTDPNTKHIGDIDCMF